MLDKNKVSRLLTTLNESVTTPELLAEETLSVYSLVEESVLEMDSMIDAAGYETQSTTLESLAEEAEAIWLESSGEMSPKMQEDFKAAMGKIKGALGKFKGHLAKLGSKMKGGFHSTMSKAHHGRELKAALRAASAFRKGDEVGFEKNVGKASSSYDKGIEHGQKAHQAYSAARGAVARKRQSAPNPYGSLAAKMKSRIGGPSKAITSSADATESAQSSVSTPESPNNDWDLSRASKHVFAPGPWRGKLKRLKRRADRRERKGTLNKDSYYNSDKS